MGWVNILSVILAPIIAVWVGQKLQDKAQKRADKISIFKTLMTSRVYGWTTESVNALNIVEVVFADNDEVIHLWRQYYEKLCTRPTTDAEYKLLNDARDNMLLGMAKSLGYEGKVTWQTIQNPYKPEGMTQTQNMQTEYIENQLQLLKNANTYFSVASRANQSIGDTQNGSHEI